jgi:uncharacterized protein YqjF (DUF2071 family)
MSNTFLSGEWKKLVMINYAIDSSILAKYLPSHTQIDRWHGTCFLSLVGFMFQNTKLLGIKVPFHMNFEEVNLRFYVRYLDGETWKRGVVFIKEIVPKPALSWVANTIFKEHYVTLPMRHTWREESGVLTVRYQWKMRNWHSFSVKTSNVLHPIGVGTEAEFITEHYWGYTKLSETSTSEYGVEHPRWEVYETSDYSIDVDFDDVYGETFAFLNKEKPRSVFLAGGSEIIVKQGRILR